MSNIMIDIKNLHTNIDDKEMLKGINLTTREDETHTVMGLDGSGEGTLSSVPVRHPAFTVTSGEVTYLGQDLLTVDAVERVHAGLFLSFQYPVEIPGMSMVNSMRSAVGERRKTQDKKPMPAGEFLKMLREKREVAGLDDRLLKRSVSEGFSGGGKKRNGVFQMAALEPRLSILDEADSGLGISALRAVTHGVNTLQRPDSACVVITHYQRLLDYIEPQFVHILYKGRIATPGEPELVLRLEDEGYDWTKEEVTKEKRQ